MGTVFASVMEMVRINDLIAEITNNHRYLFLGCGDCFDGELRPLVRLLY